MSNLTPTIIPTVKQDQAYQFLQDDFTKYVIFGGGAGGGKSWLLCEWILTNCYFYPGSKWFIGREELTRLMSSTYVTFQKVCSHHRIPHTDWKLNGQYHYIEFVNGSRIDLLDLKYLPTDPLYERFGSMEFTGGAIEEAGEVDFKAFDVLKSRIGRWQVDGYNIPAKMLITCNPKKNWLYQEIYKPFKEKKLAKEYAFVQSLYKDNPYTAKSYESDLSQITDISNKKRLMFGDWEYDDDPATLFDYDAISDLFTNSIIHYPTKYLTCDVARYGQDKTIIYIWEGFFLKEKFERQKQGIDETCKDIRDLSIQHVIPYSRIIVDEDGIGGGVVDNLRGVKGFRGGSSALDNPITHKPENFKNLRSQCYFLLADKVNNHEIRIETGDYNFKKCLTEELELTKIKDIDKEGKRQIIPKEDIKELIGRSPDYADALMMRMWFELNPRISNQTPQFVPKPFNYIRPVNL